MRYGAQRPGMMRRFEATGGDHIDIDVEGACDRSDYGDLGPDHSGDMAYMPSCAPFLTYRSTEARPTATTLDLYLLDHTEDLHERGRAACQMSSDDSRPSGHATTWPSGTKPLPWGGYITRPARSSFSRFSSRTAARWPLLTSEEKDACPTARGPACSEG